MRFLYFVLKIILHYPFILFFSKIKFINADKCFFGRTIYVSNHAASFLDPLVIGVLQRPIVFFMTRSDVFTPLLKPILWSVHMLPIYRELDGKDTKGKNEAVFKKCSTILSFGRNLLVFGEGFTDDVFIRRLKPLKKGAVKIGFNALESMQWKKKIYMKAIGINYSDPNYLGGELLISNSEKICLNDYRESYLENPSKTINEVTKKIQVLLQNQLTHVENKEWVFFHEHVSRLKRIGLHPIDSNFSIPLKLRWENSRELALWMNKQKLDENEKLINLKNEMEAYFQVLKKMNLEESYLHEFSTNGKFKLSSDLRKLIFLSPILVLGLIHFYIPYIFVKRFTEKSFKRKVFWSSVKLTLGFLVMALWNIPLVYLLNFLIIKNTYISLIYYFMLPIAGRISYSWFRILKRYKVKTNLQKIDLTKIMDKRKQLIEKIDLIYPAH